MSTKWLNMIEMPVGVRTRVGPENYVACLLDVGRSYLAHTILCQIIFDTLFILLRGRGIFFARGPGENSSTSPLTVVRV